jgi:hypothetical protein
MPNTRIPIRCRWISCLLPVLLFAFRGAAADYEAKVWGSPSPSGNEQFDPRIVVYDAKKVRKVDAPPPSPRRDESGIWSFRFPLITAETAKYTIVACAGRDYLPAKKDVAGSSIEVPLDRATGSLAGIHGRLRTEDGRPVPNREIRVSWHLKDFPCLLESITTQGDGDFELLARVPSGVEYAFSLPDQRTRPPTVTPDHVPNVVDYFVELKLGEGVLKDGYTCRVDGPHLRCPELKCPAGKSCLQRDGHVFDSPSR